MIFRIRLGATTVDLTEEQARNLARDLDDQFRGIDYDRSAEADKLAHRPSSAQGPLGPAPRVVSPGDRTVGAPFEDLMEIPFDEIRIG